MTSIHSAASRFGWFQSAFIICTLIASAFAQDQSAAFQDWKHSGAMTILTTPEGANLPATAVEEGFPLLVRLDKEWFDFKQAQAKGEDIRFSAEGKPVAYQIEDWDATKETAAIWVRIPTIKGNAHQELRMFWGKADAVSESNGKAVFNESNGYVSVWHMNDPVKDEVGTLESKDAGTAPVSGRIGEGRRFTGSAGITGGANITTYPVGNNPHSSELWIRTDEIGGSLLGWGVSKPNSVVQMGLGRPPQIRMDCFYSAAGIRSEDMVPMSQWTHVIHTYKQGDSRLYLNGRLSGVATGANVSLTIGSPADFMRIGGKGFVGEMDEVRISKVARSADWVKLQYENQKSLQTAVGALVKSGYAFAVSPATATVDEGKSVSFTAQAGGAQKVYWILKSDGQEKIVAVDRFTFTYDTGRVTGDKAVTLQCKAVYADKVETKDVAISVKEMIPDPVFTLKAPATWDGRTKIEVVPQVTNHDVMRAIAASNGFRMKWAVGPIAVIKEIEPVTEHYSSVVTMCESGKLTLTRAQNSGKLTVTATLSNGGTPVTHSVDIMVTEPKSDPWLARTPAKDEKPVDNQFYARDDKNEGTLFYNGTLDESADAVFLKLYADDKLIKTEIQKPAADKTYAFAIILKPGLIQYKVEFGTKSGNAETVQQTVNNLVCGDAYIIQGQSNAVAYNYANNTTRPDITDYSSNWIRSFGGNGEAADPTKGGWGNAVVQRLTPTSPDRVHFIGVWGMTLARKLVEDQKIPICILNGAVGGTRIDQHMPDPVDRLNTANKNYSIYRNLMRRAVAARLTHGIRGVLWHQGEADQGYDGPNNCYGCETYEQYWIDLTAAWKQDYPNLRHYYIYQIWPNACHQGGTRHSDKLRDVQRRLPRLFSSLSVMSTLGFPNGGCHFDLGDYEKMGLVMAPLVERDNYGKIFAQSITAADMKRASYTSNKRDEIALEFDKPMAWNDTTASQFYLDGEAGKVISGVASGNGIKLKLAASADAKTVTYLMDKKWDPKALLYGNNGIAALTFCEVPILDIAK